MRQQLHDLDLHRSAGQVAAGRVSVVVVSYERSAPLAGFVAPYEAASVFTAVERRHCAQGGRSLDRWAGRLAAKRAVLAVLDVPESAPALKAAEIVAGAHERAVVEPRLCRLGHRPIVRVDTSVIPVADRNDVSLEVSISHSDGAAVAVAYAVPATSDQRPTTTLT